MKNIKIYTLLLICISLQVFLFSVYGQCSVTMSATTTNSDCFESGTITATITAAAGTNLSNLNMAQCELSVWNAAGTQQLTQWATWPQVGSNSNVRIYSGITNGTYLVKFQAICNVSPYTTAEASTAVTVGGSYTAFISAATVTRKSMSCRATGQITISFSGGRTPYSFVITSAPQEYTGQTTFSNITTATLIENAASGNYTIDVTDACGTTQTRTITQAAMTLTSDVPSSHIYPYLVANPTNDCNTAIPQYTYGISTDWSYYWTNSSQYYEYAYEIGNGTPTSYAPLSNTDKRPVATLTGYDYNTFCNSGETIKFYTKPIGCNVTPTAVVMNTSSYLCNTSTAINDPKTYVVSGNCEIVQLGAEINELVGMCYPLNWEITNKSSGALIRSGTLTYPNRTISSPGAGQPTYQRGIAYQIKVTDASGRVFTASWTPIGSPQAAMKIDVNYSNGYYCNTSPGLGARDIRLYVDAEDMFLPGTIIKYVNGPQDLVMGGFGSTYTLPAGVNNFWPNSGRPHVLRGNQIMKPGKYEFEIITVYSCNTNNLSRMIEITIPNYYTIENSNFTYTTQPTCDGVEVCLSGNIQLTDGNGNYMDQPTHYRVVSSDNGALFSTANHTVGGTTCPILPWFPGIYTIGVRYNTSSNCYVHQFQVKVDPSERLSIDPFLTSHYICVGKTVGDVYVKAKGGVPNPVFAASGGVGYRYTITAAGTTSPVLAQNYTGDFPDFGAPNAIYDIKVEDKCTSFVLKDVPMIDLNNANVAFALNEGRYCEDGLVELFCISLGQATYTWKDPSGTVISTIQFPKFPAANAQSGTYTVTVQPARCPLPSTGAVDITIVQRHAPPLTVNPVTVCRSSSTTSTVNVVHLSGAVPAPGCTLNWYDEFGFPCVPPTAVSNYISGSYGGKTLLYYVAQVEGGACESDRLPVVVNIIACGGTSYLPTLTPAVSATTLCAGSTATLTVSGTAFGDILFGGYAHGVMDVIVPPITSNSPNGQLVIKFDSDGSVTYEGFDLAISCTGVPGGGGLSPIYQIPTALNTPLTVTACSGRIQNTLQTGFDLYTNSSHGYIILNPATAGAKATVSGSGRVESGYDYLTIFNGVQTLATGSSGLNIGYWISNNPNIAIVSGNTVIPVGAGSVTFSFISGSGVVTTQAVTVLGEVKISYQKTTFCTNEGTQAMKVNGATPPTTGGSITVTPSSGLSIITTPGATQGSITTGTSTPGVYRIIYAKTGDGCTLRDTTWVTIIAGPAITDFSYPATTLCASISTAQMPTLTGTLHTGGTFTSTPAGLNLDPNTGAIIPSLSTLGKYSVTYTTPSTPSCSSDSKTVSVTIGTGTPITISYPNPIGNNNPVCQGSTVLPTNNTTYTPTLNPSTATGTWEIDPPGELSFVNTNGRITVSRSTAAGVYAITFKPTSSTYCPATYIYNIITPPTISYSGSTFCTTDTQLKEVIFTGGGGGWQNGTFSSTSGLSINATTGTINPAASTPGTYTVTYNTGATSCSSTASVIIQNAAPSAIPGAISVPANICKNLSGLAFSVATTPALPAGAVYQWTFPAGWEITTGEETRTPTVTAGTIGGTVSVSFANSCGTGPASSTPVTVLNVDAPAQPNPIKGPSYTCRGNNNTYTYTIDPVPGATSYTWSVSPVNNWTIQSGQGTTSVTFKFSNQTSSTTIYVTANNSCGTGPAESLYVTVSTTTPNQPATVTGPTSVCRGDVVTYTASTVANAIYYVWTVPAGWDILSGDGTNTITVKVTGSAALVTNAVVGAAAGNGCNSNTRNSSQITVRDVPAQPSPITGTGVPNVCRNMQGITYSVTNVAGVTYTWEVPEGWTITAGQGTNQITVITGTVGGTIKVLPVNACGEGMAQATEVTMLSLNGPPPQPGTIRGSLIACRNTTGVAVYEIDPVYGATTYTWSLSPATGWTVNTNTVTGTTQIIYNLSNTAVSTTISVVASNACGSSTASTLLVTVPTTTPAQPSNITASGSNPSPCVGSGNLLTYSVTNVSGVIYDWTVPTGWNIISGQGTNQITITPTTTATNGNISVTAGNGCTSSSARTLAITTSDVPAQPTLSNGGNYICKGKSVTYSVNSVSGVTYTWAVSGIGWTPTSGSGSSITLTAGTANGNITVTPSNTCGNGLPYTWTVNVGDIPATPVIVGSTDTCRNTANITYSVKTPVAGETYSWAVSGTGWSITGGTTGNSITVTSGTATGNISVTPSNIYCSGTVGTLQVTVKTTLTPTFPTVKTNYCLGESVPELPGTSHEGITGTWTPETVNQTTTTTYTFTPTVGQCANTQTLTINIYPLAVPGITNITGTNILDVGAEEIELQATGGANYAWIYNGANAGNTAKIKIDKGGRYVVTVTTINGCSAKDSVDIKVTVIGTVFPFVKWGNTIFDAQFPITANLKPVPSPFPLSASVSTLLAIKQATPLLTTKAVYYDGSVPVPQTPIYPGFEGGVYNYMYDKIDWGTLIKEPRTDIVPTPYAEGTPVPIHHGITVGLYRLRGVMPGNYLLELQRDGFVTRWAKIEVSTTGVQYQEHRELIPGDVVENLSVDTQDETTIKLKMGGDYEKNINYEPVYDLNADGKIDQLDYNIIIKFRTLNFMNYIETKEWVNLIGY